MLLVRWDAAAMEQTFAALPVPVGVLQSTTLNEQRQRRTIGENESTPYLDMVRNTVPDAIVQCVPDTGHFTQLDAPDAVCDMIRAIAARQRH